MYVSWNASKTGHNRIWIIFIAKLCPQYLKEKTYTLNVQKNKAMTEK